MINSNVGLSLYRATYLENHKCRSENGHFFYDVFENYVRFSWIVKCVVRFHWYLTWKLARLTHRHHLLLRSFRAKWAFNYFNLAFIVMQCKRSLSHFHISRALFTAIETMQRHTYIRQPTIMG